MCTSVTRTKPTTIEPDSCDDQSDERGGVLDIGREHVLKQLAIVGLGSRVRGRTD